MFGAAIEVEFCTIRRLVQRYNYIAMDTEFHCVIAQHVRKFKSLIDYQYQALRCNVDSFKIIQAGLSFFDKNGNKPEGLSTWQFNFKFCLSRDVFAQDSINFLVRAGVMFRRHKEEGIEEFEFAQLLMTSGLVFSDEVKWLTFHSATTSVTC
ncbi:hypothetical protein HPB51_008418 [Rhipicephalus microplus]|uniref:poly(A)-specific ribonuclease n=1 Tax=Rhipicephalus microplus TaxID=6941 RepID=A0A9J6EGR3_RHIMP|nr:hypothetical protein HPB51_008418 [Rhipicephalus microplus]